MKELIIIVGVIVITGTDAFAANLKPLGGGDNSFSHARLSGSLPTQLSTTEVGSSNHPVMQESQSDFSKVRENFQLIIADFVPPDRGSPDSRDDQDSSSR